MIDWTNPLPYDANHWHELGLALASRRIAVPSWAAAGSLNTAKLAYGYYNAIKTNVDGGIWRNADGTTLTWRQLLDAINLPVVLPSSGQSVFHGKDIMVFMVEVIKRLRYRHGTITAAGSGYRAFDAQNAGGTPRNANMAALINELWQNGQDEATLWKQHIRAWAISNPWRYCERSTFTDGTHKISMYECAGDVIVRAPCRWALPASAKFEAAAPNVYYVSPTAFDAWGTGFSEGWNDVANVSHLENTITPALSAPPVSPGNFSVVPWDGGGGSDGGGGWECRQVIYDYGGTLIWQRVPAA